MKIFLISSSELASGKTLLAWSVLRALKELKISFDIIKLGSVQTEADKAELALIEDALNIKPKVVTASEMNCPEPSDVIAKACPEAELVVILGSHKIFSDPAPEETCEAKLASAVDPRIFLAIRYGDKANLIYTALTLKSYFGKKLHGVLINRVPASEFEFTLERLAKDLNSWGVPVIAVLPEDRVLKSATLNEYADIINGKMLVEVDKEPCLVESHTLGTGMYQGKLSMFKRLWQRLALLGGTEKEIEDTSFSPRLIGIVAAGRIPPDTALDVARSENIAVIHTELDAFMITERLEKAIFHPTAKQTFRIERFEKLLKNQVDLKQTIAHALE